jgi:hypothetical protein
LLVVRTSRLSHTRLCLTDNVSAENRLRDGFVLNFRGVLETSVNNGPQELGLEQEILKATGVNAHVVTLLAIRLGCGIRADLGDSGDFLW